MLLYLTDNGKSFDNVKNILQFWNDTFQDLKKGNPELTYKEFLEEGFYDEGDYILDTNTGECTDGRVFFHKIMDQSGEDR